MSFKIHRRKNRSDWDRISIHVTLADVMADLTGRPQEPTR